MNKTDALNSIRNPKACLPRHRQSTCSGRQKHDGFQAVVTRFCHGTSDGPFSQPMKCDRGPNRRDGAWERGGARGEHVRRDQQSALKRIPGTPCITGIPPQPFLNPALNPPTQTCRLSQRSTPL
ncbi:hypothetical protein AAFF_G00227720 [Aldrovandia affinis]|uniref:Uncharacterized protein n=1 Tax=Aldrovandia affinis TaxID=143900 RepID=A0AAD7X3G9_9TELE|nr:hypothetical protein AAFF_G00227720 [Aldrovandia affinis]